MERKTITTPLGKFEYSPEDRIQLPVGIPGFESVRYAIWVALAEYEPVKWIVLENEYGSTLPLFDPFMVLTEYDPVIQDDEVALLEADSPDDLAILCVLTPREHGSPTLNLRSPVVINTKKRIAMQVILQDETLPIRYQWEKPAESEVE